MLLVPLQSRVGKNLTATRRCDTTTPANPSDSRSGHCASPASRQLPGNQHGKTKEREKRRREHTTERQARERLGWSCASVLTRRSGLWAVAQVRVCSSQTRNLSLSFSELLVATHGVQTLERPGKPNSSRHAMIPATTEACIIASAELATLSQTTVPCFLSLVPGTPV